MRLVRLLPGLIAMLASAPALAAGWDTPILFSAEHMGAGGTAISYVDDPSAMFHNPAGLARTQGLTLMADLSFLTGTITGSPDPSSVSTESEQIVSPAPLLGISYAFNDWFSAGLGFYPVAAAGATYKYEEQGNNIENSTSVTFLELSPGIAFKLPGNLRLGAGYRISFLTLDRVQRNTSDPEANPKFDASLAGQNFLGLRVGLQWDPVPGLQLGLVYRHKTATEISTDEGYYLAQKTSIKSEFTLPSKLGFGARGDFAELGLPLSLMVDIEYAFQSQNEKSVFVPGPDAVDLNVVSVFDWMNAITLRTGLEYGVDDTYFVRAGYIFDDQVTRKQYPSAFGTPPAPTHTVTAGFGYRSGDSWKANAAVAYRMGSTSVTDSDVEAADQDCAACGIAGDYKIGLLGIYLDFAYSFH